MAVIVLDRNNRWSIKDLSDYDMNVVVAGLFSAADVRDGAGYGERQEQLALLGEAALEGKRYGQHVTKEES
jgi:hypothetical protein